MMSKGINCVRFAESSNKIMVFDSQQEHSQRDELWYNREDYKSWKVETRRNARVWMRQGYGELLEGTFEKPTRDAQRRMNAISQQLGDAGCFRGIERSLNENHDDERASASLHAIEGLVDHQSRMKQHGDCTDEELAQELSEFLQRHSQSASRFARRMGKADARVVGLGDGEDTSRQFLEEACSIPAPPPRLTRWNSCGSSSGASSAASPQLPRRCHLQSTDHKTIVERSSSPASARSEVLEISQTLFHLGAPPAQKQYSFCSYRV
ncbi:hypothetical protein SEMRO_1074_G238260.1 [Seminavis robusta]|uniref:Uncharacterized protein n=1 Tax=Seminavis robusta TaxID=568900 RepID=A0A9N8HPJ2_9STRA|nr:hypothetical protein SEMRO_1074_G238260.1 [Seminavis robusta]|eukprot:Sro1074_g238260.1 n/a (266) ;mRNA; r:6877-7674